MIELLPFTPGNESVAMLSAKEVSARCDKWIFARAVPCLTSEPGFHFKQCPWGG